MATTTAAFDVKFIEAIAYALNREVVLPDNYYNVMTPIQRQQAVSIAGLGQTEQIKHVMGLVNDQLDSGGTFADFQKAVKDGDIDINLPRHRLDNIFRTNIQGAYGRGRWYQQQQNKDERPYLMRDGINDIRQRPAHRVLNGVVRHIDDPFWQKHYAPDGYRCFLPDTAISGDIQGAIMRSYKGVAVELTTHSGQTFSATASHPVLTERGWVRLDSVNIGDNILRYRRPIDGSNIDGLLGQVNDDHTVTTAKDLFESFFREAFTSGGAASLKFNSDITNGKIDIDISDSGLLLNVRTNIFEGVKQVGFTRGDITAAKKRGVTSGTSETLAIIADIVFPQNTGDVAFMAVEVLCKQLLALVGCSVELDNFGFEFVINSISRSPSSTQLALDTASRLFNSLPLDRFRLGLSPESDALTNEVFRNGSSTDSGLFGYLVDTHPSLVFSDPVVDVRQFDFSDHVYDFQSSESLISSDNIITHNCRCIMRSLTESQAQAKGITDDGDLPNVPNDKDWIGGTPAQYTGNMNKLVNDKIAELAITYYKQSGAILEARQRIEAAITVMLAQPIPELATLIDEAQKLIEEESA
ncbi:MAG: phage minor head protein [Psychrobacter alimentarius]